MAGLVHGSNYFCSPQDSLVHSSWANVCMVSNWVLCTGSWDVGLAWTVQFIPVINCCSCWLVNFCTMTFHLAHSSRLVGQSFPWFVFHWLVHFGSTCTLQVSLQLGWLAQKHSKTQHFWLAKQLESKLLCVLKTKRQSVFWCHPPTSLRSKHSHQFFRRRHQRR